jgi:membrane-associated phospholipid phosphatase
MPRAGDSPPLLQQQPSDVEAQLQLVEPAPPAAAAAAAGPPPTVLRRAFAKFIYRAVPAGSDSEWLAPGQRKCSLLQVTVRWPLALQRASDGVMLLAVAYGILPWFIPLLFVGFAADVVRTGELNDVAACFLAAGAAAILNELVFKNIAKQPRPPHSANLYSHGMPSGHALSTSLLLVLLWLLPMQNTDAALTEAQLFAATVALAPVAVARVYTSDHTPEQVGGRS